MNVEKYKVIQDPIWGYRRLDPIPSDESLVQFYESQYYDLIRKGGRGPDIRRLMAGGEKAEREREWLANTLYADIAYFVGEYAPGKRVLDVGCGMGELVSYLGRVGFQACGIEPSAKAAEMAKSYGLQVFQTTLEEFVGHRPFPFDAITFLNVLEHVPDPVRVIQLAKNLLDPEGVICTWVPNDFNDLQIAAQRAKGKSPYWIAIPDHINYFDFSSLEFLLKKLGFEVVYAQGNFPMEVFLLMGDEYIGNPTIGEQCHWKRVRFEMSISKELRRRIYKALAEVGVGRHIFMVAKKMVKP